MKKFDPFIGVARICGIDRGQKTDEKFMAGEV